MFDSRESGAILPLVALVIFILFGFAAFGVDAGAAFAQRRQAQSTADAAALAAGLEFLTSSSPTNQDLYDIVRQYTNVNLGSKAPSDSAWAACSDPDKPIEYAPIMDSAVTPAVPYSDCISIKQVNGEPALLRVRLPDYQMPTAFASLIGFDTIAISATATAELRYAAQTKVLPFSIPADAGAEECLATPPSGLLPKDAVPCGGPSQGNFGMIDSPFFGAGDPHFTDAVSCPSSPGFNSGRAEHTIAIGIDHVIRTWPTSNLNPLPPIGQSSGPPPPTGSDNCASALAGEIPYILLTETGNTVTSGNPSIMETGFIGANPSPWNPAVPGRLRQASTVPPRLDTSATPAAAIPPISPASLRLSFGSYDVDNVGLWEYLIDQSPISGEECLPGNFNNLEGRALTLQMYNPDPAQSSCLEMNPPSRQIFDERILESPRFAVVPALNYLSGTQYGSKWWAITELRPVYLQSTWYDCTNGGDPECLFLPDDFDDDPTFDAGVRDSYSILFNPGEGDLSPCYINNSGNCVAPNTNRFTMQGLSAIVLDWNMFPPDAKNQYGGSAPLEVFLYQNE
ncbi:MAG: pilus assembly protein TadG-related protein [Acidimicrobiia bacterium]